MPTLHGDIVHKDMSRDTGTIWHRLLVTKRILQSTNNYLQKQRFMLKLYLKFYQCNFSRRKLCKKIYFDILISNEMRGKTLVF